MRLPYCLQGGGLANETAQPSIASTAYHQLRKRQHAITVILSDQCSTRRVWRSTVPYLGQLPGLASMWPRILSGFLSLQAGRVEEAERRLRRVLDFLGERKTYATYRNGALILG
ncbi:MAG: hypothetical protein U0175_37590 [Caldilineaceae bacterium]